MDKPATQTYIFTSPTATSKTVRLDNQGWPSKERNNMCPTCGNHWELWDKPCPFVRPPRG